MPMSEAVPLQGMLLAGHMDGWQRAWEGWVWQPEVSTHMKGAKGSKSEHYLHAGKGIDSKVQATMTARVFGHNCGAILRSTLKANFGVVC